MKAKFSLGTRVSTQKTGIPTIGIIVGVIEPEYFAWTRWKVESSLRSLEIWQKYYPDLLNYPVYYIKYDQPQFPCSFEEFLSQNQQAEDWPIEVSRSYYYSQQPQIYCVAPEQDLISINEILEQFQATEGKA